jgi:hypothetical protein
VNRKYMPCLFCSVEYLYIVLHHRRVCKWNWASLHHDAAWHWSAGWVCMSHCSFR